MDDPDFVTLQWADPFTINPEPIDSEVMAQMHAVAVEAGVIDDARETVDRAAGVWTKTPEGMNRHLIGLVLERLHEVPRLVCPHDGEIRRWTVFSGPFVVLACEEVACQEALARHVEETGHIEHCGLCVEMWRRHDRSGGVDPPGLFLFHSAAFTWAWTNARHCPPH